MKNVFIVHSWNGNTKYSFAPFIEDICKQYNINYYFIEFPKGEEATYRSWETTFDYYINNNILNKDSLVIAHSMGTSFIPKYLQNHNIKFNTYISIAGATKFINDENLQQKVKEFRPTIFGLVRLRNNVNNKYAIYSDNDNICLKEGLEEYANIIEAQKIIIKGYGHFGPKSNVSKVEELNKLVINYLNN